MQIYQFMLKAKVKEACGVFGVRNFKGESVFPYLYWGLRSQNHRGHQSHGFLTFTNGIFKENNGLGLVPKIEQKDFQDWLEKLKGNVGIGHVRYTTSGKSNEQALLRNAQPLMVESENVKVATSFNGNIVNNFQLNLEVRKRFSGISCECDAELVCRKLLIGLLDEKDLDSSVKICMKEIEGAFSVTGLTQNGELFAFKDPHGIRPLCCGHSINNKVYAFSSETVGLSINSLKQDFEIEPGELVIVSKDGFIRKRLVTSENKALCGFEFAYFSRPDSKLGTKFVYEAREEFGRNLAREYSEISRKSDIILSMPETGNDAALGLHEETGIRWERAVRRHRYVAERAFILLPDERFTTIDRKLNVLGQRINGKRVIVVDDSIVRGDTTKVVVSKLRKMGAKAIHLFITFPRIIGPCFYGIDMATYSELIGAKHEPNEIAEIVGSDSVSYQSPQGFVRATGLSKESMCLGCVTGKYPTPLAQKMANEMRNRFENGYYETGRIYETLNEKD